MSNVGAFFIGLIIGLTVGFGLGAWLWMRVKSDMRKLQSGIVTKISDRF